MDSNVSLIFSFFSQLLDRRKLLSIGQFIIMLQPATGNMKYVVKKKSNF